MSHLHPALHQAAVGEYSEQAVDVGLRGEVQARPRVTLNISLKNKLKQAPLVLWL